MCEGEGIEGKEGKYERLVGIVGSLWESLEGRDYGIALDLPIVELRVGNAGKVVLEE